MGVVAIMAIFFPYVALGVGFASFFPVEKVVARIKAKWTSMRVAKEVSVGCDDTRRRWFSLILGVALALNALWMLAGPMHWYMVYRRRCRTQGLLLSHRSRQSSEPVLDGAQG